MSHGHSPIALFPEFFIILLTDIIFDLEAALLQLLKAGNVVSACVRGLSTEIEALDGGYSDPAQPFDRLDLVMLQSQDCELWEVDVGYVHDDGRVFVPI